MAALIDRVELFNRLSTTQEKAEIFAIINDMPVIERRGRGRWQNLCKDYKVAECSVCGEVFDVSEKADKELWEVFVNAYEFCPCCGSSMDAGGTE